MGNCGITIKPVRIPSDDERRMQELKARRAKECEDCGKKLAATLVDTLRATDVSVIGAAADASGFMHEILSDLRRLGRDYAVLTK